MLFREETDKSLSTDGPPLVKEVRSSEKCWMEMVEEEALEREFDSLTDDKEALEFPLTDKLLSADSNEDVEEDTEEVCWAAVGWEEVQEEEGGRGGEAALSVVCI